VSAEGFPTDIKNCMKECILAVLWAKNDIFRFLQDTGCTSADLEPIKSYKEDSLGRAAMVERTFDHLSARQDNGLGPFRVMLRRLTEWSHFDPYYFEKLKKLDRVGADRSLDHLRQLVEIRDGKIKADRQRREATAQRQQSTTETRQSLLKRFLDLYQGRTEPQKRGYQAETLIQDMAKLEGLEVTGSFRGLGEQIDNGLKFDGENYHLEIKWQDRAASTEPLYAFAHKVEGKMYGRGIFISINGFMPEPVEGLLRGKAINTVLVDGEDLTLVLEGHVTFREMLDVKIREAQLKGEIHIHPITKKSKLG